MEDRIPRLIGLLLAGVVVLLGLRSQIGGTPGGERLFKLILAAFLIVVLGAAFMLIREERRGIVPVGPGETTVAAASATLRPAA
jgi:hypothetical protein